MRGSQQRGAGLEQAWDKQFEAYKQAFRSWPKNCLAA